MTPEHLDHVLRAASEITSEIDVLVIGSQAILGSIAHDRLPIEATTSIEADLAFFDDPDDLKADTVDGAIGELSKFHETFGYYAQGVSVSTAVLPTGWRERLVIWTSAGTGSARGLCLEAHDCVVSKLVADRDKDRAFAAALLRDRLISPDLLLARIDLLTGVDPSRISSMRSWVDRHGRRDGDADPFDRSSRLAPMADPTDDLTRHLHAMLGPDATFRDGQREAIEAVASDGAAGARRPADRLGQEPRLLDRDARPTRQGRGADADHQPAARR